MSEISNNEKWTALFEDKMKNPRNLRILKEVDTGYLSLVYILSVNGRDYSVKMYHQRYNGSNLCVKERDNIIKVSLDAAPKVIFYSKHIENEFNREILVMEKVDGVPITKEVFNDRVFVELIEVLKRLHARRLNKKLWTIDGKRVHNCRKVMMPFLRDRKVISQKRVTQHLDALENYYFENRDLFKVQKRMIHGDLWWDNILVNDGKVKIVDWLDFDEDDYCRDLAQLKIGTLDEVLDVRRSEEYFMKILNIYRREFDDETIHERMRYFLPLMYLEESFYLPFKYFPWKIKYKEDPIKFEDRFVNYFNKAETEFNERLEPNF